MKHKICHVNLARGYRGGERQTELLIRALASLGWQQRLLVRRGQPLAVRLRDVTGLAIQTLGKPFMAHVGKARGQLLHAHDGHGAKFAAAAHLCTGVPYIITRRISKMPRDHVWTRYVFRHAVAVVAVAASVARDLQIWLPELAPDVIHSALGQLPAGRAQSQMLRRDWAGRFVVVNVAALVHSQKGQRHLLAAARRLARSRSDMLFVLLGDGPDRQALQTEASDLDNVIFAGFVDNVGDYLAAADAFVLPSLHEGIGGACLDAMDFGLPIVASAVDGVPEIVRHEHNGLLVPPGDEAALEAALQRIRDDSELARYLGRRGQAMAQAHEPEVMARHYADIYQQITG